LRWLFRRQAVHFSRKGCKMTTEERLPRPQVATIAATPRKAIAPTASRMASRPLPLNRFARLQSSKAVVDSTKLIRFHRSQLIDDSLSHLHCELKDPLDLLGPGTLQSQVGVQELEHPS